MTQETALNMLKLGQNVYLTGAAGSGKTYVLNEYIAYLRKHNVEVGITASTGIAATHMGGVTIHSFTGFGIKGHLTEQDISSLLDKQYLYKRFEKLKVLIIDEVSMMHHFRLDMVDELLRAFKGNELPFGGIQVVLCGDFFQLPPISRKGEKPARFVYHSKVWRTAKFKICYLEEQHRQTDDASLRILNDIRNNEVNEDTFELLKTRFNFTYVNEKEGADFDVDLIIDKEIDLSIDDESYIEKSSTGSSFDDSSFELEKVETYKVENRPAVKLKAVTRGQIEPTRLFTHNIDVDTLNDEALDSINGEEVEYYMESHGNEVLVELLKKSCLAPEHLRLKKGAKVMFVKNNFDGGYVNGTLGVVVEADEEGPTVKTFNGDIIKVETAHWDIEEDGKVKASIIQYPLRLAWAITIHKSQGMSLDAVEVDLSRSFERGMGYVALSRVRTLDGLTILGINDMALRVHDEVLIVDQKLRAASERAEGEIEELKDKKGEKTKTGGKVADKKTDSNNETEHTELTKLHKEFIAKVGMSANDLKLKKHKVSTFEKTKELLEKHIDLKKIAKERGVTEETIIGHIETLVEEDPFFVEEISYLRKSVPYKKQGLIRQAFEKAYPELAAEAGTFGNPEYDPTVYCKAPLAPVKNIVGSKASYRDIRLMRIFG